MEGGNESLQSWNAWCLENRFAEFVLAPLRLSSRRVLVLLPDFYINININIAQRQRTDSFRPSSCSRLFILAITTGKRAIL